MSILQNWVLLVCVIAFTLCVVGGLLIVFERWQPSNPNTSKYLVSGVLVSAVAAVMPGAGNLFASAAQSDPSQEQSPTDVAVVSENDTPPPGSVQSPGDGPPSDLAGGDTAADLPDSAPAPAPSSKPPTHPPSPPSSPQPETSPEVLAWAEESLPPRPFLDQPLGSTYPPCVSGLRAGGAPVGPSADAAACFDLLQEYNSDVLNQHRDRREAYLPAVRTRARSEANGQRWQYLRQEYASFTFGDDFRNYNTLSANFRCDTHLMINLREYGLSKERAGCPSTLSEDE